MKIFCWNPTRDTFVATENISHFTWERASLFFLLRFVLYGTWMQQLFAVVLSKYIVGLMAVTEGGCGVFLREEVRWKTKRSCVVLFFFLSPFLSFVSYHILNTYTITMTVDPEIFVQRDNLRAEKERERVLGNQLTACFPLKFEPFLAPQMWLENMLFVGTDNGYNNGLSKKPTASRNLPRRNLQSNWFECTMHQVSVSRAHHVLNHRFSTLCLPIKLRLEVSRNNLENKQPASDPILFFASTCSLILPAPARPAQRQFESNSEKSMWY